VDGDEEGEGNFHLFFLDSKAIGSVSGATNAGQLCLACGIWMRCPGVSPLVLGRVAIGQSAYLYNC
jgi:hypothetical protein